MIQLPPHAGPLASLAAKNTHRYAMQGIHIVSTENSLRLEASDGHLVAIVQFPAQAEQCDLIVPSAAWTSVYQDLAKVKKDDQVKLYLDQSGPNLRVYFPNGTNMQSFHPVEGRFPTFSGSYPSVRPWSKPR